MTTIARKTFNLNKHDNMTLTRSNLEGICAQRNNDYTNEKTYWIFEDGSALVESSDDDWSSAWSVVTNYGLHRDYEQLN